MEQQQQMDEKFMSDNGWQCAPYTSYPIHSQAMIMKRDKKSSGSSSGSVKNLSYDYYEDIEDDGDSELVKTIKRLRRNKINCQPRSDLGLSVDVQAMMIRGPMSMMDATAHEVEAARVATEAVEAAQVAHLKKLASTVAREAADKFADEVASQKRRDDQEYFSDLLAGRFTEASSSPIPIPSRKKGGKKRSYKKRTNAKKRSYKKRTNAKKRSYKKRN
jgi:hypothetical protein